jgi:hypothetical protein
MRIGTGLDGKILTDQEVRALSKGLKALLGDFYTALDTASDIRLEDWLRFQAVADRCQDSRELRGVGLKAAAAALRVPQYRLKEIEGGSVNNILPDVLVRYIAYLGLTRWFGRWKKANPSLVARLALDT